MWIKIKYCIMLNNAEDIILNITDILTLPCPGHLNLALTKVVTGVSLDIENYCTLRLFFVPLSYVKLDHFDRQL